MGRPKLTLPLGGVPQIERVIRGLTAGGVDRVVVVIPPTGYAGALELETIVARAGVESVIADPVPEHMRESVELGLARLSSAGTTSPEGLVLAPGDALGVTPGLVRDIINMFRSEDADLAVATSGGRWGHPVLLRWAVAERIPRLPPGQGINSLVRAPGWKVREVSIGDPAVTADLDTPEDLEHWSRVFAGDGS
jgi:CTP:molybdopterin cytidylyltransferase MocA